jgi:hypothetical protein
MLLYVGSRDTLPGGIFCKLQMRNILFPVSHSQIQDPFLASVSGFIFGSIQPIEAGFGWVWVWLKLAADHHRGAQMGSIY